MMDSPVTWIILGVTAWISYRAFSDYGLRSRMLLNPYAVRHANQSERLFTHMLIHANWPHLIFNMFVFYSFGSILELIMVHGVPVPGTSFTGYGTMGHLFFLLLYVGAGLFATLPALLKHHNNPGYNSLGASGAVFAVMTAFVLILPAQELLFFFVIPMPGWVALIVIFAFEYYLQKRGGTGIAHDAHLWGAGFGVLAVAVMDYQFLINFFSTVFHSLTGGN